MAATRGVAGIPLCRLCGEKPLIWDARRAGWSTFIHRPLVGPAVGRGVRRALACGSDVGTASIQLVT